MLGTMLKTHVSKLRSGKFYINLHINITVSGLKENILQEMVDNNVRSDLNANHPFHVMNFVWES